MGSRAYRYLSDSCDWCDSVSLRGAYVGVGDRVDLVYHGFP